MPYQPPEFGIRTLANMAGCIVAIPLLPVFLVVKLVMIPFEKPRNLSPEQVVDYLKGFLDGTDGPWDWDNFTTRPVADPQLDDIRDRVAALDVPLSDADIGPLEALLAEAEAIAAADSNGFIR
ncbi:hypothetical protein [Sphingobium sp. MK2]|uniref:hypothetical protein n=1 Tax=Sphingobium sp. MK2 TaxID=3116540 RepID=UPI0032E35C08